MRTYRHYYRLRNSEVRGEPGHTRAHTGAQRHTDVTQTNLTTIQTHLQLSYRILPKSWLLHAPCSKGSTVGRLRRARDLFGPGSGELGWGEGA